VSCQYFPCSFVLALRAPGLRFGVNAPLPLRASSRGVPPRGPEHTVRLIVFFFILETAGLSFRAMDPHGSSPYIVVPRSPGAAVVEPRYALWGRAMHPVHVTYFTSRKSCAVGPLHPRISSSSAPCLFSCGEWIKVVSYVCHYSNISIHMITLAYPAGRVPPGDAT
jgi:hypothetical protein